MNAQKERGIENIAADINAIFEKHGVASPIYEFPNHPTEGRIFYWGNNPEMSRVFHAHKDELLPYVQEAIAWLDAQ